MRFSRLILLFLLLAGSHSVLRAQKIDTIFFQNGDKLTGEVKMLENNKLKLSTNDAGSVMVEWNKIDSVKILNTMRIEMEDGRVMFGVLLTAGFKGSCYIWRRDGDPLLVELIEIVYLSPIEEIFFNRLDGSLGSGFSYVKASQVMQLSINASVKYLAEKNHITTFYDGMLTRDPDESTQRHHGGGSFRRILKNNWFVVSQLSAEKNSELGLDLRANFGLGAGKGLIRSNHTALYTAAGLQVNRENTADVEQFNLEGALMVDYAIFIYDDPEVSLDLDGSLIPSLNDLGRIRSNISTNLKWEIFHDFYLKWTVYFSYDSRPLSEGAEKSDWAVTLLGIEYKL